MTTRAARAARSAAPDTYVVLDDDDRLVHVSAPLHDAFGNWLGHVLWDHLPAAREVYGPYFDDARASGEPVVAVVFYAGRVKRLTVIPADDGLAVHIERLETLDLTSLGTLMRSLERIERALADPGSARPDRPEHASLRALP
jgi:hypothetical protein